MKIPSGSKRALAQRLLSAESQLGPPSEEFETLVVRVCGKLRICLTRFVGADGFTTLLERSLAMARSEVPSLQTAKITDGHWQGIEELGHDTEKDVEAATAITAHLLGLLVTFIGESLTIRLIRGAFPDAFPQTIPEREDLNDQRTE